VITFEKGTQEQDTACLIRSWRCAAQGYGRRSNDSAGHSGVIAALPAMARVSDQSAHAPSPTKLLHEGREGSSPSIGDYVPAQVRGSVFPAYSHSCLLRARREKLRMYHE